jgi:hypothetical protein
METKQTAVDILFNEIRDSKAFLPDNLFSYLEDVYNKTKAMEKEQIKDAFLLSDTANGSDEDAEQYYNETYNINK